MGVGSVFLLMSFVGVWWALGGIYLVLKANVFFFMFNQATVPSSELKMAWLEKVINID